MSVGENGVVASLVDWQAYQADLKWPSPQWDEQKHFGEEWGVVFGTGRRNVMPEGPCGFEPLHLRQASGFAGGR